MRLFYFFCLSAISLSSCKAVTYTPYQCDKILHNISYQAYGSDKLSTLKINVELGDASNHFQNIRLYVLTPTGENTQATIGWLKIDKQKYKIYDITNDELNATPAISNDKVIQSYVKKCLIEPS